MEKNESVNRTALPTVTMGLGRALYLEVMKVLQNGSGASSGSGGTEEMRAIEYSLAFT